MDCEEEVGKAGGEIGVLSGSECGDRVEFEWGKELGGEVAVGVGVLFWE